MRLYIELARRSFQQTITYRAATLAGIFVNGIFGIMVASVYLALYASQGDGGMTAVEGDFHRGEVIAVRDPSGQEIARGLANYAAPEARLLCRKPSSEIERLLGYVAEPEMIHRTNLVITRNGG